MGHRDCWRRKSQLEFHVLCPRKKKIYFNGWSVETDRCCVMEYSLLTLILQSKRSNTDLCSIGSLLFNMVSWLLKHTSRQNKLIFIIIRLSDAFEKAIPHMSLPVQRKEEDADDGSSQQCQANGQTYRQLICIHRNMMSTILVALHLPVILRVS